jgi:hypothetical protein
MPPKPREHLVRGDPSLIRRLAEEKPEFFIEDATSGGSVPPADSDEAQVFINAAEEVLNQLNESVGKNGHNGDPPEAKPPEA